MIFSQLQQTWASIYKQHGTVKEGDAQMWFNVQQLRKEEAAKKITRGEAVETESGPSASMKLQKALEAKNEVPIKLLLSYMSPRLIAG